MKGITLNSAVRSAASIFIDSGAFSLYVQNVKSKGGKDYSFYDLSVGSDFRAYCDAYARFMKKMQGRVLLANIDVIYNPDLTWQVQRFFEEEHGLIPVPIVHFGTPLKYVDRYLEAGRYDLLGVGGFAWGGTGTTKWLDSFFSHICPKSNRYLPVIKVHGFALTSWRAICRWPWWSVDSTTWFTTAAYGGIYVPRKLRGKWSYDCQPYVIQVSNRSDSKKELGRHYHSLTRVEKECIDKWLQENQVALGDIGGPDCKVGRGEDSSYLHRCYINLVYFKNLEESRPPWPYPLDTQIVKQSAVQYHRGFGL